MRQQLEDLWLGRLNNANARHTHAAARSDTFALQSIQSAEVLQAQREAATALTEYRRVLRIFTDLVVYGKMPPDE